MVVCLNDVFNTYENLGSNRSILFKKSKKRSATAIKIFNRIEVVALGNVLHNPPQEAHAVNLTEQ